MAKGKRVGVKGSNLKRIQEKGQDSEESDEEYKVTEDEDYDESDECYSLDGDVSEEILADFEENRRVGRSRSTRRTSSGRKGGEVKKPRKRRRVLYTKVEDEDEDDDDDEDEEEEFDDEDDADFMSLGRKADQIKKPREKKRISYTELDDEEEEDYSELVSSGRKRNQTKKHKRKKRVSDTEDDVDGDDDDDDDDVEFIHSSRKVNQEKKLREKRKVSYTEDDDEDEDDSEFLSTSRDENQIKETREKRSVSYKEDNEEEEDENDAEFILSESDFVDYDDDSPKMKKNESISRHHPPKKSVAGGRKKSKKSKTKKSTRRKQRNGQKSGSSKEMPAKNKTQVEKRSKKVPRRRKPRVTLESDSDFVSSPSLDQEYTISEEEREQMREASVYCANLRAKLRSSSCGKHEEEPVLAQRKNPARKGKEKVEDTKDEVGKQVCGICLSEEGKRTVRGVLNCCRHYFCFSCIMEWSKVESRCPLCKQRFATITKAAKSDTGFDLRTVVIPVPECDQVYQPSEEELRGYLDPYESVICTECHHGGEDALMLLCDICDSPAHTFCVGLGREVPEGNWYCEGCRPTVFGPLSSQRATPTSDRRLSGIAPDLPSPTAGGFDLNELYVPETPLTQQQARVLPEPRVPNGDFMPVPAGTVATTLRDRRRIHRQMHHRLLNNNRMSDLVARSSGTPPSSSSSSGIRLFGSQLDHSAPQRDAHAHPHNGREDHVMPSMHDANLFSPRVDPFGGVQAHGSSLLSVDVSLQAEHSGSGVGFDSRLGYGQLHPCTNRSSIGSDASLSPYACREAIGNSRTSAGGLHAPY